LGIRIHDSSREYTCALIMWNPKPRIIIGFRRLSSPAGTLDAGFQESPSTSPDIPFEPDVDVSESEPGNDFRVQEALALNSNENGRDCSGPSPCIQGLHQMTLAERDRKIETFPAYTDQPFATRICFGRTKRGFQIAAPDVDGSHQTPSPERLTEVRMEAWATSVSGRVRIIGSRVALETAVIQLPWMWTPVLEDAV